MSHALLPEPDLACSQCGKPGAYAFDGKPLCVDCYQECGSCCADPAPASPSLPPVGGGTTNPPVEMHQLNPNCCYEACPQCSSVRRLREFQARHPLDWESRLRGPDRLVRVARQR